MMKSAQTTRELNRLGRRRQRRRLQSGFTLAELMISLVMGLIVALAAVALAKSATTSFHEQARMSGVEMTLRSASERLRSDLIKVSYMSTPNIQTDTQISRVPGAPAGARVLQLADLQGLYVQSGAGTARTQGSAAYATLHNLSPDDIFIAGNLNSDDAYRGQWVADSSCGAGGPRIRINGDADPAVARMYANGVDMVTATESVFMPGLVMTPAVPATDYAVQVTDMRGCTNYLTICAVLPNPSDAASVFLDLKGDGTKGILTPEDTRGSCGGRMMEEVTVAPIARVHWYLGSSQIGGVPDTRLYDNAIEPAGVNKFNVYRQLLAADGATPVGPAEMVAEYAIDLKLGYVIDNNTVTITTHTPTYFDMDVDPTVTTPWTNKASSTTTPGPGPQHIRSVRYRMAFRAPYFDREGPLPTTAGAPYLTRYCIGPGSLTSCKQWTRVRTVISEVMLINQEKAFY